MRKLLKLLNARYCPICAEDLDNEPFCSKHGDVSGLKMYRYNYFVAHFMKFFAGE